MKKKRMESEVSDSGETRVPPSQEQDATMVDVGDKGRPPGDSPDTRGVWVRKVAGTGLGGRPRPERLLDEGFVRERMQLEFPDGEDGEPVITIGEEVLTAMNGLWKQCLIVKVLGRNVVLSALNKKLRELWKPKGGMAVMDLPRQFFMVRFELEEEYLAALTGGPWRVFGSYLMVKGWSPKFNPLRDEIVTTPVWIRLTNIPANFYHPTILMGIAEGLGNPVKVDMTTLNFERARFARVCVEVNLTKTLKGSVSINGERYFVAYEGLANICSGCGVYGHLVHNCPRRVVERAVEKVASSTSVAVTAITPSSDGFTEVRRSGRKASPPVNKVVFAAKSSGGDSGRNIRDISKQPNKENIITSNSFGILDTDTISRELREVAISGSQNKENELISAQANKGKSIAQGNETVSNGGFEIGRQGSMNGPRNGPKDKKAGSNKVGEHNGSKTKTTKPNRPTRGLAFGPSRTEETLSSSGKRMRVEDDTVGRAGGVFVAD